MYDWGPWYIETFEIDKQKLSCSISSIPICYAPQSNIRVKSYNHLNFFRVFVVHFFSVSIYHGPHIYTRVKSYGRLNLLRASVLYFERLDILCAWIVDPIEWLWPIEFLENFCCIFLASRYIMGLTHTPEIKVMAVWICPMFSCWNSSTSICDAPKSYTRVKTFGLLNLP